MKILLAIDSSAASQVAIDQVAARPWPTDSQVRVLTVVELPEPSALAAAVDLDIAEGMNTRAHRLVEDAAKRLRSCGLQAEAKVGQGDPKTVILDHATELLDADLIIMGAHGSSSIERFLLGSVSRSVLRHAHCSVELVRPSPAPAGTPLKVLLAVDGSTGSHEAAQSVAARPWPRTAEFRVLSVVDLHLSALQVAFEIPGLDAAHLEAQRAAAMQRTEDAIDSARAILEDAGLQTAPSVSVLAAGPKEVILEEAAAWPADLIVLGSHGHGALDRFLLGSTSETVATHAACSVAVMRARRPAA
jgi:nucleotide-binding universal stress UspA family protein